MHTISYTKFMLPYYLRNSPLDKPDVRDKIESIKGPVETVGGGIPEDYCYAGIVCGFIVPF